MILEDEFSELESSINRGPYDVDFDELQSNINYPEPGFIKKTAGDIAGGLVDLGETYARAARALPGGEAAGIDEGGLTSRAISWAEDFLKRNPSLATQPDRQGFSRWFHQGLRSATTSIAAGLPGAAAGAVAGTALTANPVGAAIGAVGGYATSAGTLFGLAEYDQFLEEAVKSGVPAEEAEAAAIRSGLYEGGFEFGADILEAATLGTGRVVTPIAKEALNQGIASMFKTNIKQMLKRGAGLTAIETGSEMLTGGLQTEERARLGMTEDRFFAGATEAFGPSLVASLIFAGLGEAGRIGTTRQVKDALINPDTENKTRIAAANTIYEGIKPASEKAAALWRDNAYQAIANGQPIDLDTPVISDPVLDTSIRNEEELADMAAIQAAQNASKPVEQDIKEWTDSVKTTPIGDDDAARNILDKISREQPVAVQRGVGAEELQRQIRAEETPLPMPIEDASNMWNNVLSRKGREAVLAKSGMGIDPDKSLADLDELDQLQLINSMFNFKIKEKDKYDFIAPSEHERFGIEKPLYLKTKKEVAEEEVKFSDRHFLSRATTMPENEVRSMDKDSLKALAHFLGVSKSGNKKDLADRIMSDRAMGERLAKETTESLMQKYNKEELAQLSKETSGKRRTYLDKKTLAEMILKSFKVKREMGAKSSAMIRHELTVRNAIAAGKDIPDNVLEPFAEMGKKWAVTEWEKRGLKPFKTTAEMIEDQEAARVGEDQETVRRYLDSLTDEQKAVRPDIVSMLQNREVPEGENVIKYVNILAEATGTRDLSGKIRREIFAEREELKPSQNWLEGARKKYADVTDIGQLEEALDRFATQVTKAKQHRLDLLEGGLEARSDQEKELKTTVEDAIDRAKNTIRLSGAEAEALRERLRQLGATGSRNRFSRWQGLPVETRPLIYNISQKELIEGETETNKKLAISAQKAAIEAALKLKKKVPGKILRQYPEINLAETRRFEGITYELYHDGRVRMFDPDAQQAVGSKQYPTFAAAKEAFKKAVSQEQMPPVLEEKSYPQLLREATKLGIPKAPQEQLIEAIREKRGEAIWQLSLDEYMQQFEGADKIRRNIAEMAHSSALIQALKDQKDIPDKALAKEPNIKAAYENARQAAVNRIDQYESGADRPAAVKGLEKAEKKYLGANVQDISKPVMDLLIEFNENYGHVLLDNGAFPAAKKGTPLSHAQIKSALKKFKQFVSKTDNAGMVSVIAPDVIGDQAATMRNIRKYKKELQEIEGYGASIIVPIQKGTLSPSKQWEAYRKLFQPNTFLVAGIPSNLSKFTPDDIRELFTAENPPTDVHLLGISSKSKRIKDIAWAIPKGVDVSSDATGVRGALEEITKQTIARQDEKSVEKMEAETDTLTEIVDQNITQWGMEALGYEDDTEVLNDLSYGGKWEEQQIESAIDYFKLDNAQAVRLKASDNSIATLQSILAKDIGDQAAPLTKDEKQEARVEAIADVMKQGPSAQEIIRIMKFRTTNLEEVEKHQEILAFLDKLSVKQTLEKLGWPQQPESLYFRASDASIKTLEQIQRGLQTITMSSEEAARHQVDMTDTRLISPLIRMYEPMPSQTELAKRKTDLENFRRQYPTRKVVYMDPNQIPTKQVDRRLRRSTVEKELANLAKVIQPQKMNQTSAADLMAEWDRQAEQIKKTRKPAVKQKTPSVKAKTLKQRQQKKAETKQHISNAMGALKKINDILGNKGELSFEPVEFDESKWKKIKPLLREAWNEMLAAGKSAAEFVALSIKVLSPGGRPYFERFVQEELKDELILPGETTISDREQAALREEAVRGGQGEAAPGGVGTGEAGGETREGAAEGEPQVAGGPDQGIPSQPVGPGGRGAAAGPIAGTTPVANQGLGRNHVIEPNDILAPRGDETKIKANIKAIETLKALQKSGEQATVAQKKILAQYVGWGAFAQKIFKDEYTRYADQYRNRYKPEEFFNPETAKKYKEWETKYGEKLYPGLGGVLTKDEWKAAAASTLNAHYTSREVISAMWDIADRLGFTGGTVLEPAAGVGHFLGLMPQKFSQATQFVGVEKDALSGGILDLLYPEATTRTIPFENADFVKDNSIDLAITNVPFGKTRISDKKHPDYDGWSIHNYFLARSINTLRPGGLGIMISSNWSMDGKSWTPNRQYMSDHADLVGAIRLPNTAFKANAGTEVVTDILIFRKKDQAASGLDNRFVRTIVDDAQLKKDLEAAQIEFERLKEIKKPTKEDATALKNAGKELDRIRMRLEKTHPINEYYGENPAMVLGRHSYTGKMREAGEYTVEPTGNLDQQLQTAIGSLPQNIAGEAADLSQYRNIEFAELTAKEGTLQRDANGNIRLIENGKMVLPKYIGSNGNEIAISGKKLEKAKEYLDIKDKAKEVFQRLAMEETTDDEVTQLQAELNEVYDGFVSKYGVFNGNVGNSYLGRADNEYPIVDALEVEVDGPGNTKIYVKAPIFTTRTIHPFVEPDKADTLEDAVNISIIYRGDINPNYIAGLTGKDIADVKAQILKDGYGFVNPDTGRIEQRSLYLSGNVKKKLNKAKLAAESDPNFAANVKALEAVVPEDIDIQFVSFQLGSPWIPTDSIEGFIKKTFGVTAKVEYSETDTNSGWKVTSQYGEGSIKNNREWGSGPYSGHELLQKKLNLKRAVVRISDSRGNSHVDEEATQAANMKMEEIDREFVRWAKTDSKWSPRITRKFNDEMNGVVLQKREAPNIKFYPNASTDIELRDHQKIAVSRALQESVLMAYGVGTGKTFILVTTAMEMRRLGTARKPLIAVHNSTVDQFRESFKRLYPGAKVLIPNYNERSSKMRKKTLTSIATGDWDAIVLPQSFFDSIGNDPLRETAFVNEQITQMEDHLAELEREEGRNSFTVKELQNLIAKRRQKLQRLLERRKDEALYFEDMGVDALLIDEVHNYKRSEFYTKLNRVKGIDSGSSQKSTSLLLKSAYVKEKTGGKNIITATGTPISNTLAELWTMLRYVRPDILKEYGVTLFDSFAGTFGDIETDIEETPSGFKDVERFRKYTNGQALLNMFFSGADVRLTRDADLKLPDIKGGKSQLTIVEKSEELTDVIREIVNQWRRWENLTGMQKRAQKHVPLQLYNASKKATIDLRLIDPVRFEGVSLSKTNEAVKNIYNIWKRTREDRLTQIAFVDLYQDNAKNPRFNLHTDMKQQLVRMGIPENEVLLFSQTGNKEKLQEKYKEMIRTGEASIIIGTTSKLGVGVDIAEKLYAAHHISVPDRPMDIEQRDGRIVRQSNTNEEVEIFHYATKATLDEVLFDRLTTKQKGADQVLSGQITGYEFEDPYSAEQATFSDFAAASSGRAGKLLLEKNKLTAQRRKFQSAEQDYIRKISSTKYSLAEERALLERLKAKMPENKALADEVKALFPSETVEELTVEGQTLPRKEAYDLIEELLQIKMDELESQYLGERVGDFRFNPPLGTTAKPTLGARVDIEAGRYSGYFEVSMITNYTDSMTNEETLEPWLNDEGESSSRFMGFIDHPDSSRRAITSRLNVFDIVKRQFTHEFNTLIKHNSSAETYNIVQQQRAKDNIAEFESILASEFEYGEKITEIDNRIAEINRELTTLDTQAAMGMTAPQLADVAEASKIVDDTLKRLGLSKNVRVELKPLVSLAGKDAETSLKQWRDLASKGKTVVGAATISDIEAVIEVSLAQDLQQLEKTALHEGFHVVSTWFMPERDRNRMLAHFNGNEESAADAFAVYMQNGPLNAIGFARRALMRLKTILKQIASALRGKGFSTPETYFGKIAAGRYQTRQPVEKRITKLNVADDVFPEDVAERVKKARGIGRKGPLKERVKDWMTRTINTFRPGQLFPTLPNKYFAPENLILRRFLAISGYAKTKAVTDLRDILNPKEMTPAQYEAFTYKILLDDLIRDMEEEGGVLYGKEELPFNFKSIDEVQNSLNRVNTIVSENPQVEKALAARRAMMARLRKDLVRNGLLPKSVLNDERYFHHQVLKYAEDRALTAGTGSRDVRTHKKGWQIHRIGSIEDYNTEYLQSEFEVLAQGIAQLETKRIIDQMKKTSDMSKIMRREATADNTRLYYKLYADMLNKSVFKDGPKITPGALMTDPKLDPLFVYRRNIAIGFGKLGKMAAGGELDDMAGDYGPAIRELSDAYEAKRLEREEDAYFQRYYAPEEGSIWRLLAALAGTDRAGTKEARMVFKAIQNRKQVIKEALGDRFKTYRNIMQEYPPREGSKGWREWKPRPGSAWYLTNSISDKILEQVLEGQPLNETDVRKVYAKGLDETWVLPVELADVMDGQEFLPLAKDNPVSALAERTLNAWKRWILLNPFRITKYNLNNLSGDFDIAFAYDPKLFTYTKQAAIDLWKFHYNKEMSKELKREFDILLREDVVASGLTAQDIPDITERAEFDQLMAAMRAEKSKGIGHIKKFWESSKRFTMWRENVLRLAAYRYFHPKVAGGKRIVYGASDPIKVRAEKNDVRAAALLARELIGDYGNISKGGRWLRSRMIPFYSWMEINAPRYWRMFKNIPVEGEPQGRRLRIGGALAKKAAISTAKMALFYTMIQMFNHIVWPDEEEELGEAGRRQLHLILGRRSDGTIMTLRLQGAFSDALSWVGAENLSSTITDVRLGRKPWHQLLYDVALAPVQKLSQAVRPDIKLPMELATGRSLYPDITRPRPIRDKGEHLARTFSLDSLYRRGMGRPSAGIQEEVEGLLTYRTDPGQAAYYETQRLVRNYLEQKGIERPATEPTKRSNALYYYRRALKLKDADAAKRYLAEYYRQGGTTKGLKTSVKRAHPLALLPKAHRLRFMRWAEADGRESYKRALQWYNQVYH